MVTYVYEHKDEPGCEHDRFQIKQAMTDDALDVCPQCGLPVRRVITGGTATLYMGEGWTRKAQESDERVEERLANGDVPEVMDTRELGYYPGPNEGAVGP